MWDNIKTWLLVIAFLGICGFLYVEIMEPIIKIVFSFYGLMIAIILLIIYLQIKK
jgi:hypothetical protein